LRALYEKFIPPPARSTADRRHAAMRAWIADVRKRAPQIAASEGWFSAHVDVAYDEAANDRVTVTVDPGQRTTVGGIDIEFQGDLGGEGPERAARREALRSSWALKAGAPFRSPDWESAKSVLLESLTDRDYAAGRIATSQARVDADAARADLTIVLASGPVFTLGPVSVEGLARYPDSVIRRVVDIAPGERYSRERFAALQRRITAGPWFASVVIDIDRDPAKAEDAPVLISVVERPREDLGLAAGYGTDDGARVETSFRDRNLFGRGFDLQSSIRAAQLDQIGYVDVYLPSGLHTARSGETIPFTDSFGVLAQHTTIERLATSRFAVAGYRLFKLDQAETRVGMTYQVERDYPEGADPRIARALAPVVAFTWRRVDNLYDPRHGGVLNLQFATGARSVGSGQNFVKAYAQYQYWYPLGDDDQLLLRAELGRTFAPSRLGLPEDFLFRAGGSHSNRGYAYQGLGVIDGSAVVGGRYIATGTLEYVHWINDSWGAAFFTDGGDAGDSRKELSLHPSFGIGARYRTPAGPLGLDLAYAERERKFRLSFSVTVAF
jgi:translocation and assembly module TamA